ncbi:MAG: N-acetyltransferase [Eubacteriales bacterium]
MDVVSITLKEYRAFYKRVYRHDPCFKDNKAGILPLVCGEGSAFRRRTQQVLLAVKDQGRIRCACLLLIHQNAPQQLCLSFFEAEPDCQAAVAALLEHAARYGRRQACRHMVVSLEGHVNHGVGFPLEAGTPSFGESYCPPYYHAYFAGLRRVEFTSFEDTAAAVRARLESDLPKLEKVRSKITLAHADFGGGFRETMRRYTDLNNRIFAEHPYYYRREYDEDAQLFGAMRPLLRGRHLIFARYGDKDVGFILWYPDFNELVPPGRGASLRTFIKHKLLRQHPSTAKVVEIGVEERYRRFGTIVLLFDAALRAAAPHADTILSSWIAEENAASRAIAGHYTQNHHREYAAYETDL